MGDLSETERKHITAVLKGLANDTRILLLLGLYEGKSRDEFAAEIDMSRGGIHRNLERLREAELVYRPEDTEYELTPLGVHWAELLQHEAEILPAVFEQLAQKEEPVEKEIEETKRELKDREDESGFTFQIDENTWERTIHTEKWKRATNKVSDILDISSREDDDHL